MTATTTVQPQAAPIDEATQALTAREIAVQKIVDETGCTTEEAVSCLAWINQFVVDARANGHIWQYPTDEQMAGRDYEIFDAVMHHDAVSEPDTAHAAIESSLLDPSLGELTLKHSDQDESGSPSYCSVQVAVGVFKA